MASSRPVGATLLAIYFWLCAVAGAVGAALIALAPWTHWTLPVSFPGTAGIEQTTFNAFVLLVVEAAASVALALGTQTGRPWARFWGAAALGAIFFSSVLDAMFRFSYNVMLVLAVLGIVWLAREEAAAWFTRAAPAKPSGAPASDDPSGYRLP